MSLLHTQGDGIFSPSIRCSYLKTSRSSIVERVLLNAHREGRDFSVIVVDSRPMLEGAEPFVLFDEYIKPII
jgi:hypothetical protein